jgi:hypothetical protein
VAATSSSATDDDPTPREASSARLSVTQIIASGLAAVSTTVLLSFFGVAGTIIGAGLASVLTVVANFLYTRSIERTHAQLKPVVGQMVRPRPGAGGGPDGGTAVVLEVQPVGATDDGGDVDEGEAGATPTPPADRPRNAWLRLVERHGTFRVLAASAALVFVVVMGIVLAVELLIGKPLADAVQGTEGTGTSISRTSGTDADAPDGTNVPGGPGTGSGDEETTGGDSTEEQGGDEQPDEGGSGTAPEPEEPAEPTDPAEPVDPVEPAEPLDPEPAEPAAPEEPGDDGATSEEPSGASELELATAGMSDDLSRGATGGSDGATGTERGATD